MTVLNPEVADPPDRLTASRTVALAAAAAELDRIADLELQHGHRATAELLAWRAAELRGGLG